MFSLFSRLSDVATAISVYFSLLSSCFAVVVDGGVTVAVHLLCLLSLCVAESLVLLF